MPVRSLGWEDPLEEERAALSRILGWRIPWVEEPGGVQSPVSQLGTTERACTGVCVGVFKRVHLCVPVWARPWSVHVCTEPALSFSATSSRQCCGGPSTQEGFIQRSGRNVGWTDFKGTVRGGGQEPLPQMLSANTQIAV